MIAARAEGITPFLVVDVLERAHALEREGINIIHIEAGERDFDTPECIKEAARRGLEEGYSYYTHSLGNLAPREAVCRHYFEAHDVSVHPDQVVVTLGTSPAMLLVFSALLERGYQVHHLRPALCVLPQPYPVRPGRSCHHAGLRRRWLSVQA